MPRFQNNDGNVLVVNDLGRTVGPYEEFDFPGYDPETHGPVAGCTWLDAPPPEETEDAGDNGSGTDGSGVSPAAQEQGPAVDAKPSAKRGKAADKDKEPGE